MEALAGPPARRVSLLGQLSELITVFFGVACALLASRPLVGLFIHLYELGKLLLVDLAPERSGLLGARKGLHMVAKGATAGGAQGLTICRALNRTCK